MIQRQAVCLSFTAFINVTEGKKSQVILLHFRNLKFLLFVFACFDSISFCEKFQINF